MTRDDRDTILIEAMEHLAQAEDLVRQLEDRYLDSYVVGHINAQGTYMGTGLYQELENALNAEQDEE